MISSSSSSSTPSPLSAVRESRNLTPPYLQNRRADELACSSGPLPPPPNTYGSTAPSPAYSPMPLVSTPAPALVPPRACPARQSTHPSPEAALALREVRSKSKSRNQSGLGRAWPSSTLAPSCSGIRKLSMDPSVSAGPSPRSMETSSSKSRSRPTCGNPVCLRRQR